MTSSATVRDIHVHAGRVQVRRATDADLPDLVALWAELEQTAGRQLRESLHLAVDDVPARMRAAISNAAFRVVVATCHEQVCGMAVFTPTSFGPLSTVSAVQLHHVVVATTHRRSGVGHALLAAAASYADEVGAEHLFVAVSPALRETNRFYARLGFSPVLVRRMTTVTALRRRLTDSEHPVAALEELTRRRLMSRPRAIRSRRRFPAAGSQL